MTVHTSTYLAWLHYPQTLALLTDDREITVPHPVAHTLRHYTQDPLGDPAHDVLFAEQTLRHEAASLAATAAQTLDPIAAIQARVTQAAQHQLPERVRETHAAKAELQLATDTHNSTVRAHRVLTQRVQELRGWVVDLNIPDGWLAEAAAGWQRDPTPPAWVAVFHDDEDFVSIDHRRGIPAYWGGTALAGEHVGLEWRRDGDDEDPLPRGLQRSGPWWLTYLAETGEIVASRHSAYLLGQVWLLGRHFTDPERSLTLLTTLEPHMREPNSLLLAADVVHQHERTRKAGQC
jgi:hypothetical protein